MKIFDYIKHHWIAIFALITSLGTAWDLYRVDYGLNAFVQLEKIPSHENEDLILQVSFINSGNQSAHISNMGYCYNFAKDEDYFDPCVNISFAFSPSTMKEAEPIVIKPGEIKTTQLLFKDALDDPELIVVNGRGKWVELSMFFTIINSQGIIYKRYKENTNINVAIREDRETEEEEYSWMGNSSSVGTDGHIIDLSYTRGEFLIEEVKDLIADIF